MDLDAMKRLLRSAGELAFSTHFEDPKVRLRNIGKDAIARSLKEPNALQAVEDQGDEPRGHKYALLFDKSSRYDLKVVVSVSPGKVNVITAYIQNKKRRKVYEKWLQTLK